ncbi:MAG: glycosyltransferase family 1 protein, partial [Bacteroidaceae bacterium]|nr:glycosyltransferase family 1 protein [Bacteroidaceae bacterium]
LPILCTRNPQMPIDIEAEGCGFWLEPKDVEGWKEKLRYIADHAEEAKLMGKRGRALAEQIYNDKQCGKEIANIILNYET